MNIKEKIKELEDWKILETLHDILQSFDKHWYIGEYKGIYQIGKSVNVYVSGNSPKELLENFIHHKSGIVIENYFNVPTFLKVGSIEELKIQIQLHEVIA